MIKALDLLQDFAALTNQEIAETEEDIIYLYLAFRLNPLVGKYDCSENRINNICEIFAQHYLEQDISLDLMINSLYNYINTNKHGPADALLEDIFALLEDWCPNPIPTGA